MAFEAIRHLRLALRVVVLCVVAFAVCALSPRSASAAEKVPMCGELGQSIEAPPPLYPSNGDALAATPCDGQRQTVSVKDVVPPPHDVSPAPALDLKVALSSPLLLPRVHSTLLPVAEPSTAERRPGFVRDLERPPR